VQSQLRAPDIELTALVYPLFVREGRGIREEIASMPGIYRFSADYLLREVEKLRQLGIGKVLLFGIADEKDAYGSNAYKHENVVSNAVALLKEHFPDLTVMTDVCLCAYTAHGHCGILDGSERYPSVDNGRTVSALAAMALTHAAAGADYVAPSAMAGGQVRAIRSALDTKGYKHTKIMGYSAKFASQFYGPFRDAAASAPRFGDRRGYQLGFGDRARALKEVEDDIIEGADIVMVKPALCYLDIIREVKNTFHHTVAAYNVSGEYAMVKAGARSGWWDEKTMVFEIITALRRAGADIVITYHAPDMAQWL
jgi:porphobilinogen synthase